MTDHPTDGRPSCMVAALDTIRAAQKLKLQPGSKGKVREKLPELYWSLIAEAAIYAELAKAPTEVGIAAGSHMTTRDKQKRISRNKWERACEAELLHRVPRSKAEAEGASMIPVNHDGN